MGVLQICGSIASIISLIVSLYLVARIIKIGNEIRIQGDRNTTGGRDVNIRETR